MKKKLYIRLSLSLLLSLCFTPMAATEQGDSVDTYQNQIVSTEVFVQGRNVLTSNNVTVTSTGNLTMSAPEQILITGDFEVQLGGQLNLYCEQPRPIVYNYDSSGNLIRRQTE